MSENKDKLIDDHEYDGIQEYDNPMPAWWKNLFYLSVVFSVFYLFAHGWGYINSYGMDYREDDRVLEAKKQAFIAKQPPLKANRATIITAMVDDKSLKNGAKAFKGYCANCHGDKGQGAIGPNLTDDSWLYSHKPVEVYKIIDKGTEKGMPKWGETLSSREIIDVVGFLHSLQGTKPAKAKKAEGKKSEALMGIKPKELADAKAKLASKKGK